MRHSIFFRNFFNMCSIILSSFIILGIAFSTLSYQFAVNEKSKSMRKTADEVASNISYYNIQWDLSSPEVKMLISMLSVSSGFHTIITDGDGVVVSCSDTRFDCPHFGKVVPSSALNVLRRDGEYTGRSGFDGIYENTRHIVGVPLISRITGGVSGYVFLSGDTQFMSKIWREFSGIFMMVALSVLFVAFVISIATTKRQTEPINEMAAAAYRFARGDFMARVDTKSREDEIGQLSLAFNAMADSLERAENMRREFVANVSHELKTPMTTIIGYADGILDGTVPKEKQAEYLHVISSETRRMSRLVSSMLEMSHMQSKSVEEIRKSRFDASELIRLSLLSLEQKISGRGLGVKVSLPEEPVMTFGDKDAIMQVLCNLIDNAIKYSDEETEISVGIWKHGGQAFISVENFGPDIPEDELPLIFERFHKADRSRSVDKDSVGLGLYIVKEILGNHGENIYVTSAEGMTKFVFTLTIAN